MSEAEEYLNKKGLSNIRIGYKSEGGFYHRSDLLNEFYQHKMREVLEEMDGWAEDKYPTRDGKLCYNIARIEACNELLNHLKTKIIK